MSEYDASNIVVLEGLEPVRRRPGMYIGDVTDGSGLRHMLWEVLANVVDEHLAGHATRVLVQVRNGTITVDDDGRGIPVHSTPTGASFLERVVTTLHGTATADGHTPHVHVGSSLRGLGIACVNALSSSFEVESHTNGVRHRLSCERGLARGRLTRVGPTNRTGTRITFRPDDAIFASTELDHALVRERLWELAALNPALTVCFEHEGDVETLRAPGGMVALVAARVRERDGQPLPTWPIRAVGAHDDVQVEVALQWAGAGQPVVQGFVSQHRADSGTHVAGFWDGLLDAWTEAQGGEDVSSRALAEVLGQGLVAAVHVGLYEPRFGAPTRDRLDSREAERAVAAVLRRSLAPCFRHGAALAAALEDRFFFDIR